MRPFKSRRRSLRVEFVVVVCILALMAAAQLFAPELDQAQPSPDLSKMAPPLQSQTAKLSTTTHAQEPVAAGSSPVLSFSPPYTGASNNSSETQFGNGALVIVPPNASATTGLVSSFTKSESLCTAGHGKSCSDSDWVNTTEGLLGPSFSVSAAGNYYVTFAWTIRWNASGSPTALGIHGGLFDQTGLTWVNRSTINPDAFLDDSGVAVNYSVVTNVALSVGHTYVFSTHLATSIYTHVQVTNCNQPVLCLAVEKGAIDVASGSNFGLVRFMNLSNGIYVPTPLAASASAAPKLTDANQPIQFSLSFSGGSAPYYYGWRFGDGGFSLSQSPVHAYGSPGAYQANLTLADSGGLNATSLVVLTINPDPAAVASASPSTLDVSLSVAVSGSVTGGTAPISYNWTFGDGSIVTGQTASHSYSAPGIYSIVLTTKDSAGTVATAPMIGITVNPAPTVILFTTDSTVDVGSNLTFTSILQGGTPPFTYSYSGLPTGCSSAKSSFTCAPGSPGVYPVTVIAADADGDEAAARWSVTVNPDPTVSLTAPTSPVAVNSSFTFTAIPSGGTPPYSYRYEGLPAGCGTMDLPSLRCTPTAAGSFIVTLTMTDAVGKSASASVPLVTVPPTHAVNWFGLTTSGAYVLVGAVVAVAVAASVLTTIAVMRRRGARGSRFSDTLGAAPWQSDPETRLPNNEVEADPVHPRT